MKTARNLILALLVALLASPITPAQENEDVHRFRQAHQSGLNHLQAGEYEKAIEAFKKAIEAVADESSPYYNIACAYALMGKKKEGVQWLKEAIRHGFTDVGHIQRDADLSNLHDHPEYQQLIQNLKKNPERGPFRALPYRPKPFQAEKKYPLLIALHGDGGTAGQFSRSWRDISSAKGYVLSCVQGRQKGHRGYGWTDEAEWDILRAVEEAVEKHSADPNRVYLTGFDEGGMVAYYVGLRHPEIFAGIVPVAGLFDPSSILPLLPTAKGMGIFILHGKRDHKSLGNARTAHRLLKAHGKLEVKYLEHTAGHEFPRNRKKILGGILDWLNGLRVVGGRTKKPDIQKVWY